MANIIALALYFASSTPFIVLALAWMRRRSWPPYRMKVLAAAVVLVLAPFAVVPVWELGRMERVQLLDWLNAVMKCAMPPAAGGGVLLLARDLPLAFPVLSGRRRWPWWQLVLLAYAIAVATFGLNTWLAPIFAGPVSEPLGLVPPSAEALSEPSSIARVVLDLFSLVVMSAVYEEIIFRGVAQIGLLRSLRRVVAPARYAVAIVVPAVWWVFVHYAPSDPPSMGRVLVFVAEGCAYGAIARVGGLELTVVSHALVNLHVAVAKGWLPTHAILF